FSNMQYGIESANARFNIKNCSFTDLGTGIFIHNYTSAINVYHSITDQCFFDRVQYAVFINGGKNDMIQNNSFGTTTSLQSQNFCGIFSHSSSGFSILDNDFNSFNYGIRIMKSGSNGGFIKNSIRDKGNIFFSCKKSIETVSDNSALKIKCNTHTNNPTAYFRNWTNVGTLAPQGESPDNDVTKPAGNTFTPFGYQQLSSNSNYIYYCHNNPWTVKPVSVSNVSVNDQNSLTFISTTACPINNTSQPISVLETRFNQLNTANSILRLRFDSVVNILDRGQTAVLLSMIQGNTSEGNLKNKLLANSPLSDNVVSELISTNKLAPGNFKNVMSKNLPVTKTVEPAFLNKITQLPPGIADQLIKLHANNPGVVTLASIQRELDRNNITQKEIMARLTRIYIDSSQTDKAIQLLETQNDAGSKQTLISSLIAENRLAEASTLLGSFTPADDDEADWVIVNNILLSLETQGNTIYDLNSDQTLQLRDIATTCPAGLAAVNAQSILRIVFNDKFIPCPDDTLSSARYRNTPETNTNTSFPVVDEENIFLGDNYPNPFNHKTVIPYYLPEGFIAVMQINDVHGRLLSEYSLKTGKNLMEIDTEEWAAGVYYYSLISNGETLQNKKMVLVK
ncbi:MAG: T9SS type A sorting domain-containing protein, partial [Bacteroidia bacterium]|nr:T9SS type A sorting domain-containing protein [Bacteroidia bacterium]